MLEETSTHDRVVRTPELEEQWLTTGKDAELAAPRLRSPEVHFLNRLTAGEPSQVVEPLLVRNRNVGFQR